jgi:hypothetical protein
MNMLMKVRMPHEPFNSLVRKGTAGKIMKSILKELKPEAVYFTEENGVRTALLIVNMNDPSEIPSLSEPWFLNFKADCEMKVVMTPADLERAGLEKLGKKWG